MNLLTANMRREKEEWKRQATKEGLEEGRKEGLKEGRNQVEIIGEKRGIKLVAQKMKEKGIEINLISSITGLKIEEI